MKGKPFLLERCPVEMLGVFQMRWGGLRHGLGAGSKHDDDEAPAARVTQGKSLKQGTVRCPSAAAAQLF